MSAEELQRVLTRLRDDAAFREQLLAAPLTAMQEYDLAGDDRRQIVLPNFGWLIEDTLAGASRPRTDDAFAVLHTLGVRALLSLTEDPLPSRSLDKFAFKAEHVPIADFSAPDLGQIERALAAISRFLDNRLPVAVHCGAGFGRTGTILACYLVWPGTSSDAAIASVRARRPGSIATREQETVVALYARHLRDTSRPTK